MSLHLSLLFHNNLLLVLYLLPGYQTRSLSTTYKRWRASSIVKYLVWASVVARSMGLTTRVFFSSRVVLFECICSEILSAGISRYNFHITCRNQFPIQLSIIHLFTLLRAIYKRSYLHHLDSATASAPLCRVINSPTRHPLHLPMMSTIYVAALNPKRNRNTARRAEEEEILNSNENVTFLMNLTNELFHIHPSMPYIYRQVLKISFGNVVWKWSVFDKEDNVPRLEEEMKTSHSNDTSQI